MGKTFREGCDELKRMVGSGTLTGTIANDQLYSHYQDSGFGPHGTPAAMFKHPRGGEAGFLSGQVNERRDEVMSAWARRVLDGGLVPETIRLLRSFADQVFIRAPREFEILRNSTSLKLSDDRAPVFYQPAMIPRLSEAEIKAIRYSGNQTGPRLKGRYR